MTVVAVFSYYGPLFVNMLWACLQQAVFTLFNLRSCFVRILTYFLKMFIFIMSQSDSVKSNP